MIVVVGGHTRNIGKTSVVCSIIGQTRDLRWSAVKITQFGHQVCSHDGEPCECRPEDADHPYALDEQKTADSTDSGRFLDAGAARSYWLRTRQGELAEGMGALRRILAEGENTIVESNSLIDYLRPDAYLFVVDPQVEDFKITAQRNQSLADAVVQTGPGRLPRMLTGKPLFLGMQPDGLGDWIRQRADAKVSVSTRR